MRYFYLLLNLLMLCVSCTFKGNTFKGAGLWVGNYQVYDKNDPQHIYPVNFYINPQTGLGMKDDVPVQVKFSTDSIYWGTYRYKSERKDNQLIVNNRIYFSHALPSAVFPADTNALRALIQETTWENKHIIYQFASGKLTVTFKKQQKKIHLYYRTECHEGYVFIRGFGNKWEPDKYFKYFNSQVLEATDKKLVLYGFDGERYATLKLKKTTHNPSSGTDGTGFECCDPFIAKNRPWNRYYSSGATYNGGIYQINKEIGPQYRIPEDAVGESGLVRIMFVVNCKGETGLFEVLELDGNYQQKHFPSSVTTQLLQLTQSLKGWVPGKTKEGTAVDAYKFLTFKIKNGAVIEIFP